jgi:hypothetical protein
LDEDARRADRWAQLIKGPNVPADSRFYWHFSQRIKGILPRLAAEEVKFDVALEEGDLTGRVLVAGKWRTFLAAFADKLVKMNRERVVVNQYLPDPLRYKRFRIQFHAIPTVDGLNVPIEIVLGDGATASIIKDAFARGVFTKHNRLLGKAVEYFLDDNKLSAAKELLEELYQIRDDLPSLAKLRVLYNLACACCRLSSRRRQGDKAESDRALEYLKEWINTGLSGAWEENGYLAVYEMYRMARDEDLSSLRGGRIKELRQIVPDHLAHCLERPRERYYSGGGCVLRGTRISTPEGARSIESLREGDPVLTRTTAGIVTTRIVSLVPSRGHEFIDIGGRLRVTPQQRVLRQSGDWVVAADIRRGFELATETFASHRVEWVQSTNEYCEVFDVMVEDGDHRYLAEGLVLHNKAFRAELASIP